MATAAPLRLRLATPSRHGQPCASERVSYVSPLQHPPTQLSRTALRTAMRSSVHGLHAAQGWLYSRDSSDPQRDWAPHAHCPPALMSRYGDAPTSMLVSGVFCDKGYAIFFKGDIKMNRRLIFQKTARLDCPDAIEMLLLASKQAALEEKRTAIISRRMSPRMSPRPTTTKQNKRLSGGKPSTAAAPKHGCE